MNIALWIAQCLLAIAFTVSAVMKGTWDLDRLEKSGQAGAQGLPLPLVRFIAFAELCGALGLIQPWATGIVPALTVAAAVGLGVIMILAAVVHTRLREPRPCLPQRLVARLRITPPATTMMSPRPSRRSSASRRGR